MRCVTSENRLKIHVCTLLAAIELLASFGMVVIWDNVVDHSKMIEEHVDSKPDLNLGFHHRNGTYHIEAARYHQNIMYCSVPPLKADRCLDVLTGKSRDFTEKASQSN